MINTAVKQRYVIGCLITYISSDKFNGMATGCSMPLESKEDGRRGEWADDSVQK